MADLRHRWDTLYKQTLPALARSKAPSQPQWPVHLDHCFARIILDAVIGNSRDPEDGNACPWTRRLKAPAVKNMSPAQLKECLALGEAIAEGRANLVELDQASLAVRGKTKGGKRKREDDPPLSTTVNARKKQIPKTNITKSKQATIHAALGLPTPTPTASASASASRPPPPATIPPSLSTRISTHPSLTPFRRCVLLALCQVPPGHYTTYLALSNYLHSSPRAVGNALRNNPFAPEAPCHRVVAADGGIGGFGGEWGVQGKHNGEKVRLLRGEGVDVNGDGGRVRGKVWEGFV